MTPERHALVKEIFLGAVACPPEERAAYLQRRCGDDTELQREVERLIAHHNDATISPSADEPGVATDAWRREGHQVDLDAEAVPESVQGTRTSPRASAQDLEPGTIVKGRYRITTCLGRGGMGVVYKAEDNVLGSTVALKVLNPKMAQNAVWLERFRNEVRAAREITHRNVCRIFDIGECDGLHFISMEYVDGEDLQTSLRRIGRFAREKAIGVARELCTGLAAAHGAGFLHRDLKPANVMLDGRGHVRITDFGLAATPESIREGEVRSGTPAYMAPEQIAGLEVTIRSDIYSLGLVLYELFSGRQAFEADSIETFAALHAMGEPTEISDIVSDVDPDVERIIEQCLRKVPEERPASALEVVAALPGVDPLAVALAAEQTPSPTMVARAGPAGARTAAAGQLFVLSLALLAGAVAVRGLTPSYGERDFGRQPAVLMESARALIQRAGYSIDNMDFAFGYANKRDVKAAIPAPCAESFQRKPLATDAELVFWYRQSSNWLAPRAVENIAFGAGRVTPSDPPLNSAAGAFVALDPQGRLLLFIAEPTAGTIDGFTEGAADRATPWMTLMASADLEQSSEAVETRSQRIPFLGDEEVAWRAARTQESASDLSVAGAAWKGRPVFFAVFSRADSPSEPFFARHRQFFVVTLFRILLLAITAVALPWAWRNHRKGRIDLRGAWRLAIFVACAQFLVWALQARFIPAFNTELLRICVGILRALGQAALLVVFYAALEPYARRHWPQLLISWSRAVSGRVFDPMVGLHVLIGVCVGLGWAALQAGDHALVDGLGWAVYPSMVDHELASKVLGARLAIANYLGVVPNALLRGLLFLLLLAGLRALVHRPLWASILAAVVLVPLVVPRGAHFATSWLTLGIFGIGIGVWIMARFGLVAVATAMVVAFIINTSPITLDPRSWYFDVTLFASGLVLGVAVLAYIAGRRTPPPGTTMQTA